MNTLPQLNENGHLGSPESASPPHAAHLRKHSMNGTLPGVAEDSRLMSPPGTPLAFCMRSGLCRQSLGVPSCNSPAWLKFLEHRCRILCASRDTGALSITGALMRCIEQHDRTVTKWGHALQMTQGQ